MHDRSHTPHRLQSTLTPAQEAVAVALRKSLLFPLDDLLSVVREFLKGLDLGRRELSRFDPRFHKRSPKNPFLSACCFEPDMNWSGHLTDHRDQVFMPFW